MNYNKTFEEIIFHQDSNINLGLDNSEISKRQKIYGKNILLHKQKSPLVIKFLNQFKDFLIIILLLASIISVIVNPNDWLDSLIILFVVLLNGILGLIQETSAEKALEALEKLSSYHSKVIRNGKIMVISSSELVPGDILILEAGNYVPADARIIEANNLTVDESSITGESKNVIKTAEIINNEENIPLGDQYNMIFSSTFITNGNGKAIITKTGMNTEVGKIAQFLNDTDSIITPLQSKLNQIGKIIGIICLLICILVFVLKYISGNNINESFITAVALAVAAIPEGLSTIVTVILSIGVNRMAKKNAIVKKLPAVETLGCTSIICTDKTGTLTENKMTITSIYTDFLKDINANLTSNDKELIKFLCLNSNAKTDNTDTLIGDPIEIAILDTYLNKVSKILPNEKKIFELPFDSKRKMMTSIIYHNNQYYIITKGAPDIVSNLSINKIYTKNMLKASDEMSSQGLRVIALAYKTLSKLPKKLDSESLENNLHCFGIIGMKDPIRTGVKESIIEAKQAGIRPIILTGDYIKTAEKIALELNILDDEHLSISSNELNDLSDEDFFNSIEKYTVYARVTPADKVRIVETWQKKGFVVAMTGDGVNDAPALKKADIGCAMGKNGTDVAKEASDLILVDDNFTTIISAVEEGRNIYANIKKVVMFLLSSNIGEVYTIFISILLYAFFNFTQFSNEGPLLAIHLLWVNLITDTLPAFALGFEKNNDDLMSIPPRNKKESFFANHMILKIIFQGFIVGTLTLLAFLIGQEYSLKTGQTMAFITLATSQLFHAFNQKSNQSILKDNIFNNPYLIISFITGFFLLIIITYVKPLSDIFKLTPISIKQLLICIGLSFSVIIFVEIYKLFTNKK